MTNHLFSSSYAAAMRRAVAAKYIGVSPSHFDKLVQSHVMPPAKTALDVRLWLKDELDDALMNLSEEQRGSSQCQSEYTLNI